MDNFGRRNLPPGASAVIGDFLALNRRRVRPDPPLTEHERERWTDLRWQLEEFLGDGAYVGDRVRQALRVPTDLPVCLPNGDEICAREIAELGLFLATEHPSPAGTPLRLQIRGDDGETLDVKGRVAWARGGESPGMGVRFDDLDPNQFQQVATLVEQALAAL